MRDLFNGTSFQGWGSKSENHGWVVTDGMFHLATPKAGAGKHDLYTIERFTDFILELEYRIAPQTNSGVYFRISDLDNPDDWRFTGFEMQIIDPIQHEKLDPKRRTAAIYDIVGPSQDVAKLAGEWNTAQITCEGPQIAIALNGVVVTQLDVSLCTKPNMSPDGTPNKYPYAYANMPRNGHIGIQDHGGEIWFRNIRIKQL